MLELTEQGFYELRAQSGDTVNAVVASNVDPAESDLTAMDPKEIVAAATAGPIAAGRGQPPGCRRHPKSRSDRSGCGGTCSSSASCCWAGYADFEPDVESLNGDGSLGVFWR